jgi:hypothetical protein
MRNIFQSLSVVSSLLFFSQLAIAACDCGSTNPASACTGNSVSYTRQGETISIEFECNGGACLCGKFANEWDFWVAPTAPGGIVTVTAMSPKAVGEGTTYRNGAQFGPTNMASLNGFDGRENSAFKGYDAMRSLKVPFNVNPSALGRPETIMKSISEADTLCNTSNRLCLRYVESLTVLDTPPGNVFRPAYFGIEKAMIPLSSFDDSILSNLAPTPNTISWADAYERVKSMHPQHYVENQNSRQGYTARINTQVSDGYDGYYGTTLMPAVLKLVEAAQGNDVALKRLVAKSVAQLGIDLWAIHKEGGTVNPTTGSYNMSIVPCGAWPANGGFNQNRLVPILLADAMLHQTWHESLNQTFATSAGLNCFGETGFIQPPNVTAPGKGVPLFGNLYGGTGGITSYSASCNANNVSSEFLTDGGGWGRDRDAAGDCVKEKTPTGSRTPTSYQICCTHGHWLGSAMAVWLTPAVFDSFPSNAKYWLDYVDRSRSTGVEAGSEFGSYSTPTDFSVTGFNSSYDKQVYYELWNAYRACSKTQSCTGMASSVAPPLPPRLNVE